MSALNTPHDRGRPPRASDVPLEVERIHRARRRRGGPRTPFPLLPVIGICVGIGVAYVSETAHATQATYEMSALQAQQAQLLAQDQRVSDSLDRLESSARIAAAAQQLGMRPASRWAYVTAAQAPVAAPDVPSVMSSPDATPAPDPVQRLITALGGGTTGASQQ